MREGIETFEELLQLDPDSSHGRENLNELKASLSAKVRQVFVPDMFRCYFWPDFMFPFFMSSFYLLRWRDWYWDFYLNNVPSIGLLMPGLVHFMAFNFMLRGLYTIFIYFHGLYAHLLWYYLCYVTSSNFQW